MKELSFHTKLMCMLVIHFVLFLYATITNWSWLFLLLVWLAAKAVGYIGNEIGMHRLWSHKSFKTEKWKEMLMHICAVLYFAGRVLLTLEFIDNTMHLAILNETHTKQDQH